MQKSLIMKSSTFFILALLVSYIHLSEAQTQISDSFKINESSLGKLRTEHPLGDYLFQFYYDDDCQDDKCGGSVLIKKGGQIVYSELYNCFAAGIVSIDNHPDNQNDQNPYINNLVGDPTPEIVLETHSGGAHCCYSYIMFSLDKEMTPIWHVDMQDAACEFKDLNHDGNYEILTYDTIFDYWQSSHADSACPKVVLHYIDGFYLLDMNSMSQNPRYSASAANIQTQFGDKDIASFQQDPWKQASVPPMLWKTVLDLIYTGNSREAWEFYEQAWPEGAPGKQEFLQALIAKLKTSPYWPDLEKIISLPGEE